MISHTEKKYQLTNAEIHIIVNALAHTLMDKRVKNEKPSEEELELFTDYNEMDGLNSMVEYESNRALINYFDFGEN